MHRFLLVIGLGLASTSAGAQSSGEAQQYLWDAVRFVSECPELSLDTEIANQLAAVAGISVPEAQVKTKSESRLALLPSLKPAPEPLPPPPDGALPLPKPPLGALPQEETSCSKAVKLYGPEGTRIAGLIRLVTDQQQGEPAKRRPE